MQDDLLVLEASTVISGLRVLNSLNDSSSYRLMDTEPIGSGGFLILVRGEGDELQALASQAANKTNLKDSELIKSVDQKVLDAVFSLAPTRLQDALVVLETETATAMLTLAQHFVTVFGLQPLEIKLRKSAVGAYGYFTGSRNKCADAFADAKKSFQTSPRKGDIEIFDPPSNSLRALFED